MKEFEVYSGYRQFYVADIDLNPGAPEEWTEQNILERHLPEENLAAFVPENDISAHIFAFGPGEVISDFGPADFQVTTTILVPSRKVGVLGWPWELKDSYTLNEKTCHIRFSGYKTDLVGENQDFYTLEVSEEEFT